MHLKQGFVANGPDGKHPFGEIDAEPACLPAGDNEDCHFSPAQGSFSDQPELNVLVGSSHHRRCLNPLDARHLERLIFLRMELAKLLQVKRLYLLQTAFIVIVLAVLPYLVLRGPADRLVRWWLSRASSPGHGRIQHG